jgi:hypothetical protein
MAAIEKNPFSRFTPLANIQSIVLSTNIDFLDLSTDPLTGTEVNLVINAKTIDAHKVFSTDSTGIPYMRLLEAADIPDIQMSQVSGLDDALQALVKTLTTPPGAYLSLASDSQGNHIINANTGQVAGTLATGDDDRFPASVTGIRLGTGIGSNDTAAVKGTDYWGTDVFGASGGSHAIGLVPDPGASAGTTKFLREDGQWITPSGAGTVTSVGLTMPAEFSVSGSPVTSSGTLAVTLATQVANSIFAGPSSGPDAPPTFRAIAYDDVSSFVGSASSTIAAGNDTRFPASVTGLRKSTGAGSTDVAAVAKTDYWNTDVFVGVGPSHAKGLVPDPGAGSLTNRYLREDGSWQMFSPADASLANVKLAVMAANTLKANATSSSASPTDVSAKTARSSSLLNLESITTNGDSDYAMVATDKYVATSATLTSDRIWTLPLANTFNPGQIITISDDFGGVNITNQLKVSRSGADLIQGSSTTLILDAKYSSVTLASDGVNKWSVVRRSPAIVRKIFTSNGTYNTPTGVKVLFVEGLAGGGGGGGALGGSSECSVGGGGGAGGFASVLINAPSSSYAMLIGSGGLGGVGNSPGTNGGDTAFASVLECQGGGAGDSLSTGTSNALIPNGGGGGGVTGDMLVLGSAGSVGIRFSGTLGLAGKGGNSQYAGATAGSTFEANGNNSVGYGGGGSGAVSLTATSKTGGNGSQGVIIVTEYY